MKPLVAIILALCLVVLGAFAVIKIKEQHNRQAALPVPKTVSSAEIQLMIAMWDKDLIAVKGTGSMRPYIPGGDDEATVAYVEIERVSFGTLKENDLVVYRAPDTNILHQLVDRDSDGWIVSGLHNRYYDDLRVTADNYVGRVVHTYILR